MCRDGYTSTRFTLRHIQRHPLILRVEAESFVLFRRKRADSHG